MNFNLTPATEESIENMDNERIEYLKKVEEKVDFMKNSNKVVYFGIKRIFDFIFAIIGIIFLLPIMLFIKLSYLFAGDKDSIFYTQNRVGKNGKIFKLYKFRSMIYNADEELEKILANDPERRKEYEINKKLKNDPRITKTGQILRKTSLDELPQVINIFLGNMSLIGNRPYLPREKDDMGMYYTSIISTKPGLTGYWQVHGRNDVTFERRLQLEKYYSEHCGFKMDICIFFKTFKVVLFGRGAN